MKKFNYKLEIGIFRNCTQNNLGVLGGAFLGFGCPIRHPDALLAKTRIIPGLNLGMSIILFWNKDCNCRV